MSLTTDSLKNPAGEAATDEPDLKKPKITEKNDTEKSAPSVDTTSNGTNTKDNNNGNNSTKNNNNINSSCSTSKAANGNNKQQREEVDDGDGANLDGSFDPKIAKSLEQVENIQLEICNLNEKASEEILTIEQRFNKLRRPHFEKRNELLKEIPNFWLTSLANHPIIAPMIESPEDEDCLHYMLNLDVEEFEDIKSGFKLKLYFVENPYITNEVIVKEFQIVSNEEMVSSSTPIEFKNTTQGKDLKQVVETSIAQYRRSRRPGHNQHHQSFFAWLAEPSESGGDEIAEILKDQIWPNPLEFFFSTPEDYEGGTDDDVSDDEDEEIDDDEELDDEDEGDDDEGVILAEGGEYSGEEELDDDEDDDDDDDGEDEDVDSMP